MTFSFASSTDQETFMSLKGLANKNSGFFKSVKQAQYMFKAYSEAAIDGMELARQNAALFMGVPSADDQIIVSVTAYTRWADYGSRSVIPMMFVFVLDKMGVVAQYKVTGNGNLRDGWGPDPKKTKQVWVRAADAVCPWEFPPVEAVADKPVKISEWLGVPGEKVEVDLKLVRTRYLGLSRFGEMFISVFETEKGDVVNVWKDLDLEVGSVIKVKGTVKANDIYKETKQTTLIRVKVL